MKMIYKLLLVTLLGMPFSSCDDFLELSSQDLIIPQTVSHYKELLQGDAYFKDIMRESWFVELMADNVEYKPVFSQATDGSSTVNVYLTKGENVYNWFPEIEETFGDETLFRYLYKQILIANVCLADIDKASGAGSEKDKLRGQACFTRAYAYFMLANLYSQAYNEAKETDLCVPLVLDPQPSLKRYSRATIKEVWTQITTDVTTALTCLKKCTDIVSLYEINYNAVLVLATRVALFMEKYEDVIQYGGEFLINHPELYNISEITESPTLTDANNCFLFPGVNKEIVFLFGIANKMQWENVLDNRDDVECFRVSEVSKSPLMSLYGEGDRRKTYWFVPYGTTGDDWNEMFGSGYDFMNESRYCPAKYNRYDIKGGGYQFALRGGEVYLSMAEAYARKENPDKDKALKYLNDLRRNRVASYTDLASGDFASMEGLIHFTWEERRRELCFEEMHRWWDLRRTGQPELVHDWQNVAYRLTEKDPAYVMNFPRYERDFNPDLVGNVRPVREKENKH